MNEHRRILVVDDEPQITRVLRTSLSSQAYDIRVANDGETALEIMKDWTPDLVNTDFCMPNMNGLELTRRLRLISQLPILILSVRGRGTDQSAGLGTRVPPRLEMRVTTPGPAAAPISGPRTGS